MSVRTHVSGHGSAWRPSHPVTWASEDAGQTSPKGTPIDRNSRRRTGRDRPITFPGSPSIPSTNQAPRPSSVNAPATRKGSPVST